METMLKPVSRKRLALAEKFLFELLSPSKELRQNNHIPSCLIDKGAEKLHKLFNEWKQGEDTEDAQDFDNHLDIWITLGFPTPAADMLSTSVFYKASENPIADIALVTYAGQKAEKRQYHGGYEHYFNRLPVLRPYDNLLSAEIDFSRQVMQRVAADLRKDPWIYEQQPEQLGFNRSILAIEPSTEAELGRKEGAEMLVAKWGNGHSSPVHGHSPGFIHEDIIVGKMRVNRYRMTGKHKVVRLVRTDIVGPGTFASVYSSPTDPTFKRQALIHNFTSVGYSASLHFLPEHTRDGRDNTFTVENFEDQHTLLPEDVDQITGQQGLYLQVGEVVLVRSSNVPEYGDHYIVTTGHPVMKEHGMRPQDVAIAAAEYNLLNEFSPTNGVTLLKLKPHARDLFLEFHDIKVVKEPLKPTEVIFPETD